jgi:hypothetical protein
MLSPRRSRQATSVRISPSAAAALPQAFCTDAVRSEECAPELGCAALDLPTAHAAHYELTAAGIRADLKTLSEAMEELPAEYAVAVYLSGISLEHLELVVGIAKKFSKDFGIDERSRLMFI